ncbi:MAG: oligosaccharide flippase family protein [Bacteroidota bacterium]
MAFIKSATKNSLIYGIGNVSTKIIGFILLPLYTYHLSVQEYGILGILEVSSQLVVSIFGLSLSYSFFRWYWDKEYADMRHSIMFTCLSALLFVVLILIGTGVVFASKLSMILFDSPRYSMLVILLVISSSLQILASIPSSLMQLQQRSLLFTVVNTSQLAITLIATIICVASFKMNVLGIYIAQIIGGIVYFLFLLKYILDNIVFRFNFRILKGMLSISMPLVFGSISGVIINIADRYMLRYFGHLSDVGIYSLGYKIANTIYVVVVMSINLAITPMLYKIMDDPNNKRVYSKVMTYVALGVMFCVMGISFFGREIIKVMAQNPEYWNSYKVIPFISFGIYFGMLKDISAVGLNLTKKTKIISVIVVTISIVNILANALLIPIFQTIGAAIASLISQFLFFLLMYIFAQRYYFIPYEYVKLFLLSVVGMIIILMGSLVQDVQISVRLLTKLCLLASFPLILYVLKFFEPIEIDRLHGVLIKWRNPIHWKNNLGELFNKPV